MLQAPRCFRRHGASTATLPRSFPINLLEEKKGGAGAEKDGNWPGSPNVKHSP